MRTVDDLTKIWPVTHTVDSAKTLLRSCPLRHGKLNHWGVPSVEVDIGGVWLLLDRTDLKGDVCTYDSNDGRLPLEDVRKRYMERIKYGARIRDGSFSAVDQFSDG